MSEGKSSSDELRSLLVRLSGHLEINSSQEEHLIQSIREAIAGADNPEDVSSLARNRFFSIENSDLFFARNIDLGQMQQLENIVNRASKRSTAVENKNLRVFVRDVPVRSTQIAGSTPMWAGGASVEKTIGPFVNLDGRRIWFDFYKITQLVALYIDGQVNPAILFNVSLLNRRRPSNEATLPLTVDPLSTYKLVPDTIWINSKILAPDAPDDVYTGLKIKGGEMTLSNSPAVTNGKLTISSGTVVNVKLDLDESSPDNFASTVDTMNPHGIDARNMRLSLPKKFSFHFSDVGGTIDEVSDADMQWQVYGHDATFLWNSQQPAPKYEPNLNRVLIPLTCSENSFMINNCKSELIDLTGHAAIIWSAWALPAAKIDIARPSTAAGVGGIAIQCNNGLRIKWKGLEGGNIRLASPYVMCDIGRINITDMQAGNNYCNQEYVLWKESNKGAVIVNLSGDSSNNNNKDDASSDSKINSSFEASIKLRYTNNFPLIYNTLASGAELLQVRADANPLLDRPTSVSGYPFDIRSKNSTLIIAFTKSFQSIYLFDDTVLLDNHELNLSSAVNFLKPLAIALHNAVFKVTPVNGILLVGELSSDMVRLWRGKLFVVFGMLAYLPILPDPYAANLGNLKYQFGGRSSARASSSTSGAFMSLICQIHWKPLEHDGSNNSNDGDAVEMSFHFASSHNIQSQLHQLIMENPAGQRLSHTSSSSSTPTPVVDNSISAHPATPSDNISIRNLTVDTEKIEDIQARPLTKALSGGDIVSNAMRSMMRPSSRGLTNEQERWDRYFSGLQRDVFSLLDVSSNANQWGITFGRLGEIPRPMVETHRVKITSMAEDTATAAQNALPFEVDGMDVASRGVFVSSFTVPQISWEPVVNFAKDEKPGDPPIPVNYYPDDGGPTKILNNSPQLVPLAPIPAAEFLVKEYNSNFNPGNNVDAVAQFTLPFGLRALAWLTKNVENQIKKPGIWFNSPHFADGNLKGGIQFQLNAGSGSNEEESNMFHGFTLQINNILDAQGIKTGASTLGFDVASIFNNEFFDDGRGVPLTRIDLSGYGSSIFSNWVNKGAKFAETSQARFDVVVGRTSHEVVQVKSILYPWGIRVVRTITLFRVGSGYVYRYDSGWKAESDGKFDFRFKFKNTAGSETLVCPYSIHPGVIMGIYDIRNIRSAVSDVQPFISKMSLTGFYQIDTSDNTIVPSSTGGNAEEEVNLQPVYFDADIEIENITQGHVNGRVPSKKILGFVQLAPRGIPLTPKSFYAFLERYGDSIGGSIDCIIDIGKNGQKMRLNRFDVNNSTDETNTRPVFVVAARGSPVLPKEGSWSMVMHTQSTGNVTPVQEDLPVPLVRVGELSNDLTFPVDKLLRIANPSELLRMPNDETINFGFLQSTNTQKALFLTPSFQNLSSDGVTTIPGVLLSKTPPLFADAFRLLNSKAIFPNIGDATADTNFGDVIALTEGFDSQGALTDGGKEVLKLMHINSTDGISAVKEEGYKLYNAIKKFDLPDSKWHLIDEDYLKVYVEYDAQIQNQDGTTETRPGKLDYDIDSFAQQWKSRLNNLAMVVDLGPFERLMTIKGNFDAKKGYEAAYVGAEGDADFVAPQIEFSKDLQPIIDILQILQELQGGDYAESLKKGLRIAMSNNTGLNSWEYKFEASKEIPVVKFPAPDIPNAPLKLEASLKVGVYFNAGLTTSALTDPEKLLPTAGAFMEFYGRLSVMCVSVSVGSVYAVGQVNLRIAADTKTGPSLTMKFGFGAQVVVGLPVVGNASVLYLMGTEIYADSEKLDISAFLLYQGHAELLGGVVDVTISIEAKGTISRSGNRTDCMAQVTFGLDISIFLVIDIEFSESWQEERQIA